MGSPRTGRAAGCDEPCDHLFEAAALSARLVEAEALLERVVKYVTEDRARTPGSTRLARLVSKIRGFLEPACAEVVHRDDKPCNRPDCPLVAKS